LNESIVAGATDRRGTTQSGYGLVFFADLLVDGAPAAIDGRLLLLETPKQFLKKSFSIVNCPIFRSSSA
jgi:hypothetical protein